MKNLFGALFGVTTALMSLSSPTFNSVTLVSAEAIPSTLTSSTYFNCTSLKVSIWLSSLPVAVNAVTSTPVTVLSVSHANTNSNPLFSSVISSDFVPSSKINWAFALVKYPFPWVCELNTETSFNLEGVFKSKCKVIGNLTCSGNLPST